MPRGHRRGRRKETEISPEEAIERSQRTVIFMKTKMCKFFILGACSKGASCKFAHRKEDLQSLPDLACTKLCKTLISTGACDDPNCRYAHNREELKHMPGITSNLLAQLDECEAAEIAAAAGANQDADEQSQQQMLQTQLQQQLRQQLSLLQLSTAGSSSQSSQEAFAPGRLQAAASMPSPNVAPAAAAAGPLPTAPEFAPIWQQLQAAGNMSTGNSENQAALLQQMMSLSNMAAQAAALHWAAAQQAAVETATSASTTSTTPTLVSQSRPDAAGPLAVGMLQPGALRPDPQPSAIRQERIPTFQTGRSRQPATGKVVHLADELAEHAEPEQFSSHLQHPIGSILEQPGQLQQLHQQLQQQLDQQQQIKRQLQAQLQEKQVQGQPSKVQPQSLQPPKQIKSEALQQQASSAKRDHLSDKSKLNYVVKNTFIDVDGGSEEHDVLPPRNKTWCAGLNMVLGEDEVDEVDDERVAGAIEPLAQKPGKLEPAQLQQHQLHQKGTLHCVPENRRLCGMGRQVSECSETSVTSTETPPHTEKRHQDTPLLNQHRRRYSSSPESSAGSNLSALDEEPEELEELREVEHPRSSTPKGSRISVKDTISPNTKLQQEFGAVVKNTFIEFESEETPAGGLRLVQTAAGRLDSLAGFPSSASLDSLEK
eukprot:TRINITY_DN63362_c0_g1_i1.p1 TRINITY_DN63362_c0_g1~~TRINITY_DN63362_c0_g1_i1.p1  ORF type:complete len:656 (+),score=179.75 TRINITY_DN63362_c0_g1_i1:58-2025(+)